MTDRSKTGFERFCSIPAFWISLLVSRVRRGVPVWTRPYSIRDPCRNRRSRARCLLLTGDFLPATSNLHKSTVALAATGRIVEIVQDTGASLSLCRLHNTHTGVPRVLEAAIGRHLRAAVVELSKSCSGHQTADCPNKGYRTLRLSIMVHPPSPRIVLTPVLSTTLPRPFSARELPGAGSGVVLRRLLHPAEVDRQSDHQPLDRVEVGTVLQHVPRQLRIVGDDAVDAEVHHR